MHMYAYRCVAIILYRHNSRRIARDAGSAEVPNDLGLHVMRVEATDGWDGQAGRLTITNANGSDELIYLH